MCSTYLTFFMRDELLDEMPLYPYPDTAPQGNNGDPSAEIFMAPSVTYSYDQVNDKNENDNGLVGPKSPLRALGSHSLFFPSAALGVRRQRNTCQWAVGQTAEGFVAEGKDVFSAT